MALGKFYGVGLGPGDPGLVTLRALEVLRAVQVIYAAASQQSSRSVSGRILDALPGVTADRCELAFTMSNNFDERLARIDEHAARILDRLRSGDDAAFVTIGDPMTYSTCGYLLRALLRMEPALPYEIIPGVNSWSALAAKEGVPLVEDQTVLQIVPAAVAPGSEELDQLLAAAAKTQMRPPFCSSATVRGRNCSGSFPNGDSALSTAPESDWRRSLFRTIPRRLRIVHGNICRC